MPGNGAYIGFMIVTGFLSACFGVVTVWRLYDYIQAYRFEREKYYPLFGLIPLRLITVIYLVGILVIAGTSTILFGVF